jgi:hypothetical protein
MGYQMTKGRFIKGTDYIDIAGTMNNWGGYDLLYPVANDSNYVLTMNISRDAIIAQVLLSFKFRINGNWNTTELPNLPNRMFQVMDTVGGHVNLVDVWYDDQDPYIPVPPFATDVSIQGNLVSGVPLSGAYSYEDVNGDAEGISKYKWYHADDTIGTNLTPIIGATEIAYLATDTVVGKYLVFEVTPVAKTGDTLTGKPVRAYSVVKVGAVGINELSGLTINIYPNPVNDVLTFDLQNKIDRIEIYSMSGKLLNALDVREQEKTVINTSDLAPGAYLVKFIKGTRFAFSKFILE